MCNCKKGHKAKAVRQQGIKQDIPKPNAAPNAK